ncbi:MAG: three-Cys-motif partner protein TcmP [Acidobacteriota bacterium]|nr:three-Cys-motif partner protein TcmP [Acidobacteriota bacterium]
MNQTKQLFGGGWTEEKLERVRKYLNAYVKIMSNQKDATGALKYRFAYIDAFAGTGYRAIKRTNSQNSVLQELLFQEENESDSVMLPDQDQFLDGSARIALQIQPQFHKYIFIERDRNRFAELHNLKEEFPSHDITLINADANSYLQDLCLNYSWKKNRAVLFLDPFGMEVTWETIKAIAKTKAIDLWLLFPLGVAVNRMLTKNGRIYPAWQKRLNEMFGTDDWYEAFYQAYSQTDLITGEQIIFTYKSTNFNLIEQYFVRRLKSIFAGVAENPLRLLNSHNNPLYLLCFASGNPVGAKTAVKIAQNILER